MLESVQLNLPIYLNKIITNEDSTVKITKCREKVEIPQIKEEIDGFEKLKL